MRATIRSGLAAIGVLALTAFAGVSSPAEAKTYPWCVFYDSIDLQLRLHELRAVHADGPGRPRLLPAEPVRGVAQASNAGPHGIEQLRAVHPGTRMC